MESYPPLWQDLEISNMSTTALTAWLKRAEHNGYNLRSARISSGSFNDKCRNNIRRLQRRPKLERFELHFNSKFASISQMLPDPSQYLKKLVVSDGSWVLISHVKLILADYPRLEHVEFHAVLERDSPCSWPEMPNLQFIFLRALAEKSTRVFRTNGLGLAWVSLFSPT